MTDIFNKKLSSNDDGKQTRSTGDTNEDKKVSPNQDEQQKEKIEKEFTQPKVEPEQGTPEDGFYKK